MSYYQDKVFIISGASSGIGEHLAREMVRRGAAVGLMARRQERLESLAEELRASGGRAAWAVADVQSTEAVHQAMDQLQQELGDVFGIIANAGFGRPEPVSKHKAGRSEVLYDVNLLGMIRMIDWALPAMVERRAGHIVGVASIASYLGFPITPSYSGSKAAMRVHLQGLRCSLKRYGVSVTTICPGFIKSELTDRNDFKMPFLWETDRAVRYMANAIERRRGEVAFPWQMRWLVRGFATRLPTSWVEALMSRGGKR
ncbi:MAG: SDR family NAD(P)-dependent oxidoreductase [Acidobacteriota bacterium]